MSKARVAVLHIVSGQLSVTAAAQTYGFSRQHLHRLLKRYREGGLEAVDARSRRPGSNPRAVSDEIIIAIVGLREQLTADGLDAGPLTLQWHLRHAGLSVPATSTIRRILHHHGLITPQPRKRPKSSYHRFEAAQPNECWQSDFTHWSLADGTDVEILNWLDDHSRYLLACTAYCACQRPRRGGQLHRRPQPSTACPHPPSPTTDLYTPHDSPTATTTSNAYSPAWASPRKTVTPATPKPKAKSNDSTKPSNAGSARAAAPPPSPTCNNSSTTFAAVYNTQRPHRALPPPHHTSTGLQRPAQSPPQPTNPPNTSASATTPSTNSANSPCATAAACTTSASATTHARTPVLIRGHPTTVTVISKTDLPTHLQPHHRPRPQLLAQPTKTPRPMAGAICNR